MDIHSCTDLWYLAWKTKKTGWFQHVILLPDPTWIQVDGQTHPVSPPCQRLLALPIWAERLLFIDIPPLVDSPLTLRVLMHTSDFNK